MKINNKTNCGLQNTTQKTTDWATRTALKPGEGELRLNQSRFNNINNNINV